MNTVKAGGRPILFAAIAASSAFFAVPANAEPDSNSNDTPSGTTTFYGYGSPSNPASSPVSAPAAVAAATREPVLEASSRKLDDKGFASKTIAEDRAALSSFYQSRSAPLWVTDGGWNSRATAVIAEIKKADDWGLQASAFELPEVAAGASPDALGEADVRLSIAVLKYARHARGGRVEPLSISNIWDMKPELKDPKAVIADIADNATPDTYLTSLHPKHAGFHNLRQALLKARGPQEPEKIDEALKIKLPTDGTIKPGAEHADISLLRKRLKLEANSASNDTLYDARLEAAVKAFQEEKGIKANGILNAKTRGALNREGEPKKADPSRGADRIVINMERWRWLPEELGSMYVMNNVPEFMGRVKKGDQTLWEEKIIVGLPTWPTPILTSSMQFVIFNPEWGVPDGIKVKELLPRLKRASGNSGGGFFDQLFGGGGSSSGGARVLAAYGLKPSINGRPVDANSVDWNRVDIRSFSFVQPSGGANPLGTVKFRFPNRHDVYMHDTTQRALFGQSRRALSHGCIRVENPRKLAEVLLGEDKGWSSQKVGSMYGGGSNEVTLTKEVPVYLTYFTASADSDGKIKTFGDLYGQDSRVMQALAGRAVKYDAPDHSNDDEVAEASGSYVPAAGPSSKKTGNKKASQQAARRPQNETAGDILSNALSGLLSN